MYNFAAENCDIKTTINTIQKDEENSICCLHDSLYYGG